MTSEVTVTFLGGLGDIGRNCAAIEYQDQLLILDCGQLFANEFEPGVDSILPDVDYLFDRSDKQMAAVITHGHEDHLGAIAEVISRGLRFPIYASAFTLGLIRSRLGERGLANAVEMIEVKDDDQIDIGAFSIEFLAVTHSVPGGLISAIDTPQGLILHSSDFKLDPNPIDGRLTNMKRIRELSQNPGIRLLMADSTNSDSAGSTLSESEMGPSLAEIFSENTDRRIITACFSSHMHRVQQIIDVALSHGRKVATLGMSMRRNLALARELGLVQVSDKAFFDIKDIDDFDPGEVCVISTGTQGEARSSLFVASTGASRWISVNDRDTVVLSSTAIPGNEARVSQMINNLTERGAHVIHSGVAEVHTSGHAKRDELAELHKAANPQWFVPVHGELRHMVAHRELATSLGMTKSRALLATDGDQVVLANNGLHLNHKATKGHHMLLNGGFLGPDQGMLQERINMGSDGMVMVAVVVDFEAGSQVCEPWLEQRGWLQPQNAETLRSALLERVSAAVNTELKNPDWSSSTLTRKVRRAAGSFVNETTSRRPVIVPVVIDI